VIDLKACCVLVTPTSYAKHDPRLRTALEEAVGEVIYSDTGRPLSSTQLRELLPGCDGYIAGLDAIDRNALEIADRLRVIARYGVGVDNVDLEAAKAHGIVVTNTPGANSESVAELTIGLMLSLARTIPAAANATRNGEWPRLSGVSISGKVVGLLGLGAIGKQVARRLRRFNCTVLAHDPFVDQDVAAAVGVELRSRNDVVEQADFLSLHLPVLPETSGMVNTDFLNQMKAGSFLINTSRGQLVIEAALLAALENGHLRGAALDAFSTEPPGADNPLLALPQVIATPHIGAHTDGAANAMGWRALHDCMAVLREKQPACRVI
jgi:D-3-phosphoglycerate dehydrogenase